MDYVELHAHSNFSLLDGACFPEQLVGAARGLGMKALALTDHDGLYGVPQFFRAARDMGLKPIVGAELTLEDGLPRYPARKGSEGLWQPLPPDHEGPAFRHEGQIPFSLSPVSPMGAKALSASRGAKEGRSRGSSCREGGRMRKGPPFDTGLSSPPAAFYLELSTTLTRKIPGCAGSSSELAGKTGIPPVVTNNVHYRKRQDYRLHDVLTCIRHRESLDDSAPFRRPNSEYYLKGAEEMRFLLGMPEMAIRQTLAIAEACDFDLDFSSYRFPDFPLPEGASAPAFLRQLCYERAPENTAAYRPR